MKLEPLTDEISGKNTMNLGDDSKGSKVVDDEFSGTETLYRCVEMFVLGSKKGYTSFLSLLLPLYHSSLIKPDATLNGLQQTAYETRFLNSRYLYTAIFESGN